VLDSAPVEDDPNSCRG